MKVKRFTAVAISLVAVLLMVFASGCGKSANTSSSAVSDESVTAQVIGTWQSKMYDRTTQKPIDETSVTSVFKADGSYTMTTVDKSGKSSQDSGTFVASSENENHYLNLTSDSGSSKVRFTVNGNTLTTYSTSGYEMVSTKTA